MLIQILCALCLACQISRGIVKSQSLYPPCLVDHIELFLHLFGRVTDFHTPIHIKKQFYLVPLSFKRSIDLSIPKWQIHPFQLKGNDLPMVVCETINERSLTLTTLKYFCNFKPRRQNRVFQFEIIINQGSYSHEETEFQDFSRTLSGFSRT